MNGGVATRRRIVWRISLTLWNLLTPGVGLLRTAGLRVAAPWLAAPFTVAAAMGVLFALAPIPRFGAFVIFVAVFVGIGITVVTVSAVLTWRSSKYRANILPWWRRWYAVLGLWILLSLISQVVAPVLHAFYKPYYIPAQSMMPTLAVNDRIVADMRRRTLPHRGDLVIYKCGGFARVSRVAALPGDRVAMRDDRPIVNGVPATQHDEGSTIITVLGQAQRARVRREEIPGEVHSHRILVLGGGGFADMAETPVPTGYLFLLGDDRDLAADSRVPMTEDGCGMVAASAVLGRPLFITWSHDHSRIGTDLTRN